jgi:cell division transport system permease protein
MHGQTAYLILEAFRSLRRHKSVILPSLATIFLCSFLLAASVCALFGSLALYHRVGVFYTAEAFLDAAPASVPSLAQVDSLEAQILQIPHVASAEYISPDLALVDFKTHFGAAMLDLVEENPLPASFRVSLAATAWRPDSLEQVARALEALPGVEQVRTSADFARKLEQYRTPALLWPSVVAALMLFFVWLIVGNAVRLTLLSRRELVQNMKYAGADFGFIEFPFVLEGVLQGLIGSLLAGACLVAFLGAATGHFPILLHYLPHSLGVVCLCAGVVCLACATSSYRAVRRFLNNF